MDLNALKAEAAKGDMKAQIDLGKRLAGLGEYYSKGGGGVSRDYDEAFKLFRLLAGQGNSEAQFALYNCYLIGFGAYRSVPLGIMPGDAHSEMRNRFHQYFLGVGSAGSANILTMLAQ